MAYREFRNEATYEAPEFQGMPRTLAALDTANRIKAQQGLRDRSLQDKLYNLDDGKFIQNTRRMHDRAALVVEATRQWNASGKKGIPDEARVLMLQNEADAKKGSNLFEAMKSFEQNLTSDNDPYLKKGDALRFLDDSRLKDLDEIEKDLSTFNPKQDPKYFNVTKYTDDFVKGFGEKSFETDNDVNGIKNKNTIKGQFFTNDEKLGIDPRIVEKYLSDDPRADAFYTQAMLKDLNQELKQIIAGRMNELPDTKEGITLRGLIQNGEDNAAINYLREHPEINPIDQRTEFERKADKIVPELKDREKVNKGKVYDDSDKNPWNKFSSSGSINTNMQFAQGHTPNHGPSVVAVTKTGNVPSAKAANPSGIVKNSITGKTSKIGGAGADVSVVDWYYGVVDKNGVPINIPSEDTEQAIEYINTAPIDEVRNWSGAFPVARGSMLNKSNIIDAKQKLQKVVTDLERRKDNLSEVEKSDLYELSKQLNEEDNPDFSNEIVQSYLKDIVSNVTYKMDEATATSYEAQTGINPLSKKAMTPDQKAVKEAVDKRIRGLAEEEKKVKDQNDAIRKAGLNPNQKQGDQVPEMGIKIPKGQQKKSNTYKPSYKLDDGKSITMDELQKSYPQEKIDEYIKAGILK